MPNEKPKAKRATKATAENLMKSKDDFAVEFTIKRGEKTFALQLKPLSVEERKRIFADKQPMPAAMLLPPLNDKGYVVEGGNKVFRYVDKADMMYPNTTPEAKKAFEEWQAQVEAWQSRVNNRAVFYVLPDDIRANYNEKYKQETDDNIAKFLNDLFMPGELDALHGMYDRLTNAVGVEYAPFSIAPFLDSLEDGNLPNLG